MFEVKTTNFKIILSQLITVIENLDFGEPVDSQKEIAMCITIGEELLKQFDIIQTKLLSYQGSESPSRRRSLEKKVEIMKKTIEDADVLQHKYKECLLKNEEIVKQNKTFHQKIDNLNDIIHKLEDQIREKVLELNILNKEKEIELSQKKIEQLKKEECEKNKKEEDLKQEEGQNNTISYLKKLNEGNGKVIQQKNDKIFTLETEVSIYKNKIDDTCNSIKEMENEISSLKQANSNLVISLENISNKKDIACFETEIVYIKQKEDLENMKIQLESARQEIINLKLHKDQNETDLKKPLLERQMTYREFENETETCSKCCIL